MYFRTCELKMRFYYCLEIGSWGGWLLALSFFFEKYSLVLTILLTSKASSYCFSSDYYW